VKGELFDTSIPIDARDARFSLCRTYRYSLTRYWRHPGPELVVIGLNPSTADEKQDDPTIRRCIDFAQRWEFSGLIMLNLFAYRSTDPLGLRGVADPVGPDNDAVLRSITRDRRVLCAWGAATKVSKLVHGPNGRARAVLEQLATRDLVCLRRTKAGHPEHPLYVPGNTQPIRFGGCS
jgi:hypothetical protein